MDLNSVITLQKVNVAIILQFKYNPEKFVDLFSESMKKLDDFKRIDTVDTEWFDEKNFRDRIFGVANESERSKGEICRYSFDGNKVVFGDDKNKHYIQKGHTYSVCCDDTDEFHFKINNMSIALWDLGIGYACFNFELLECLSKKTMLFSDVSQFITAFDLSKRIEHILIHESTESPSKDKRVKISFRDIICGSSNKRNKSSKKLGFFQILTDTFAKRDIELSVNIDELKENYIAYLISPGIINDIQCDADDIKTFLAPDEFSTLVKSTDFSWLNKNTQDHLMIGCNKRKGIDNHYWNISDSGMICFGYKDNFLINGGLWKNIFEKYMVLFQYCLNLQKECLLFSKQTSEENKFLYEKCYRKMFMNNGKQEHVQKLFDYYLRKLRRQIKREQLNLKEHKKIIAAAANSDECFLPLENDILEDPFVFLSYCRRDYKKVYEIIDFMYKNGVNVCYDKGIHIQKGEHWTYTIDNIINSPNCMGVIFFVSKELLQSDAAIQEAMQAKRLGIPCISISLNHEKCSTLIRNREIVFTDFGDENNISVQKILEHMDVKRIAEIVKGFALDKEPEHVWFERYEKDLLPSLRNYKWIEKF